MKYSGTVKYLFMGFKNAAQPVVTEKREDSGGQDNIMAAHTALESSHSLIKLIDEYLKSTNEQQKKEISLRLEKESQYRNFRA